jgi:hypothetical protein
VLHGARQYLPSWINATSSAIAHIVIEGPVAYVAPETDADSSPMPVLFAKLLADDDEH